MLKKYTLEFAQLASILFSFVLAPIDVRAQSDLDRCNDILRTGLMNESSSSTSTAMRARTAYQEMLFELDSTSAFQEYQKARDSHKKQATSGSGDFGYAFGFIDASAAGSHSFDRQISETEFKSKFDAVQRQRKNEKQGSSDQQSSAIAVVRSSTRDSASVVAWERCMTQRRVAGLYAYGFRDESGNPFVVAMWTPGDFASSFPSINLQFPPQPGISIVGARNNLQVAVGSGVSFPIQFTSPADKRATRDSFSVPVNGQLVKITGERVNSFQATAIIPAFTGEIPCEEFFLADRTYILRMTSPGDELQVAMRLSRGPDGNADRLRAQVDKPFGAPQMKQELMLSGSTARLISRARDSRFRDTTLFEASCKGTGVSAAMVETAIIDPTIKISVRRVD